MKQDKMDLWATRTESTLLIPGIKLCHFGLPITVSAFSSVGSETFPKFMNVKLEISHGHLEADLREPVEDWVGAAVICHPHPVYGGTMHTKAVFRAAQALNDLGFGVLRFNFRGVGASTGSFDDGVGEAEDARVALNWLSERAGDLPIVMGGFSFGSMVGLGVGISDSRVSALLGLGLPIEMYDYSYLADSNKPILIVQGENDDFSPAPEVIRALGSFGDHLTIKEIKSADHYFNGCFDELQEAIRSYFEDWMTGGSRAEI